jgi:hypothetical protein
MDSRGWSGNALLARRPPNYRTAQVDPGGLQGEWTAEYDQETNRIILQVEREIQEWIAKDPRARGHLPWAIAFKRACPALFWESHIDRRRIIHHWLVDHGRRNPNVVSRPRPIVAQTDPGGLQKEWHDQIVQDVLQHLEFFDRSDDPLDLLQALQFTHPEVCKGGGKSAEFEFSILQEIRKLINGRGWILDAWGRCHPPKKTRKAQIDPGGLQADWRASWMEPLAQKTVAEIRRLQKKHPHVDYTNRHSIIWVSSTIDSNDPNMDKWPGIEADFQVLYDRVREILEEGRT